MDVGVGGNSVEEMAATRIAFPMGGYGIDLTNGNGVFPPCLVRVEFGFPRGARNLMAAVGFVSV